MEVSAFPDSSIKYIHSNQISSMGLRTMKNQKRRPLPSDLVLPPKEIPFQSPLRVLFKKIKTVAVCFLCQALS